MNLLVKLVAGTTRLAGRALAPVLRRTAARAADGLASATSGLRTDLATAAGGLRDDLVAAAGGLRDDLVAAASQLRVELVPPPDTGVYRPERNRYEAWLRAVLRDDILQFMPRAGPGSLPVHLRRWSEAFAPPVSQPCPEVTFRQPRPGDVIKRPVRDSLYQFLATHYGVYISDDLVIHYNSPDSDTCAEANRVVTCTLAAFAAGYGVVIEEYADLPPRAPDEVEATARALLGTAGYDLFSRNCEHFATWCRYGRAFSSQSRRETGAFM